MTEGYHETCQKLLTFGSLFTGIGGFDLGFEKAGMQCLFQIEIDKDCRRVLKGHWPNVELLNDVRTVGKLPDVDVLCGGFPCQDLSVAGKRKGLAGERSGLWFEFLRIAELNRPRWLVIENVPGLLSSDEGRDFAAIIRGLVGVGYRIAWRVTDAQYFGVAQRRRRVFIVGSLGDGSCAEVLFERESVSWNPPTRGEAGARIARSLTGSTGDCSAKEQQYTFIGGNGKPLNDLAATLDQRGRGPTDSVMMNLQIQPGYIHPRQTRGSESSNQVGIKPDAHVADALTQEGPGAVMVAAPITASYGKQLDNSDRTGGPPNPIAFSSKDHGADAGSISPTLRAQNFKDSHINGGGQVAIAFHENKSGQIHEAEVLGLRAGASYSYQGVGGNLGVRRLTPTECERLQGFPDSWTAVDAEGKTISDSARYRMLGNAVAVPNARWIGRRFKNLRQLTTTCVTSGTETHLTV